jgi:CheY-like chemotaxis protein
MADTPPTSGRPSTDATAPETIDVLLVDDSPDLLEVVSRLLERNTDDLRVRTATSALDAFGVLQEGSVDCIVSDYKMPAVDGLEFCREVRREYPDLAFIIFTNKDADDFEAVAADSGVTACVDKDADRSEYGVLAAAIRGAVAAGD